MAPKTVNHFNPLWVEGDFKGEYKDLKYNIFRNRKNFYLRDYAELRTRMSIIDDELLHMHELCQGLHNARTNTYADSCRAEIIYSKERVEQLLDKIKKRIGTFKTRESQIQPFNWQQWLKLKGYISKTEIGDVTILSRVGSTNDKKRGSKLAREYKRDWHVSQFLYLESTPKFVEALDIKRAKEENELMNAATTFRIPPKPKRYVNRGTPKKIKENKLEALYIYKKEGKDKQPIPLPALIKITEFKKKIREILKDKEARRLAGQVGEPGVAGDKKGRYPVPNKQYYKTLNKLAEPILLSEISSVKKPVIQVNYRYAKVNKPDICHHSDSIYRTKISNEDIIKRDPDFIFGQSVVRKMTGYEHDDNSWFAVKNNNSQYCIPAHCMPYLRANTLTVQYKEKPVLLKYPDVYTTDGFEFAPITEDCYLRSPTGERVSADRYINIRASYLNGMRENCAVKAFKYNKCDLVSGTPVYNSYGNLCSIITCSDSKGTFALSNKFIKPIGCCTWANNYHSSTAEMKRLEYFDASIPFIRGRSQLEVEGDPNAIRVIHATPNAGKLSSTHHHYVDALTSKLLYWPVNVNDVYVNGKAYPVNYSKSLVSYSIHNGILQTAKLPTIQTDEPLYCGTPVYYEHKICSIITKSDGRNNYVLTKFGENVTIIVETDTVIVKKPSKIYTYGSHEFDTKEELTHYIANPINDGNKVIIWNWGGSVYVSFEKNGLEHVKIRYSRPLADIEHSLVTRKEISRSLEVNKVAAELAYINTRMANLNMHANNATELDKQLTGKSTLKKKRRNNKKKSVMAKVVSATTGFISMLFMLMMLFTLATSASTPLTTSPSTIKPAYDCASLISMDLTAMPFDKLVHYKHCGEPTTNYITAIESERRRETKLKIKNRVDTYREANLLSRIFKEYSTKCSTGCDGITNKKSVILSENLKQSELYLRSHMLKYLQHNYEVGILLNADINAEHDLIECKTRLQHFESVKPVENEDALTLLTCKKALKELSGLEEEIFHMRFDSKTFEYHGSTSLKCNDTNWDKNRYLLNGAGRSCQKELVSTIEGKGECIKSEENNCYSGSHDECALGNNPVIEEKGVIYSKSAIKKNQICCTLDCFSKQELYLSLTNQPFCTTCIKPFFGLLWHNDCSINLSNIPLPIDDLKIYSYNTVFNVGGKTFTCRNLYNFEACCGGKGAASNRDHVDYIDKLCACKISKTSNIQSIINRSKAIVEDLIETRKYTKIVIILILVFLFPRFTAVMLLMLIWITYATASCELNDMVPLPANSKNYNKDLSWPVRVRLTKGDCVDAGDYTLEVVTIKRLSSYKFLSSMPYKIKSVCSGFDWGCHLGRGSAVVHEKDKCELACTHGIFYKHTAIQSYFDGSSCAILSGIHTKLTACFSAGNLGSEVKIFSRLSVESSVKLETIRHRQGVDLSTEIDMDDNSTLLISEPSRDYNIWPQMVAIRGGDRFCSYDIIDISRHCHTADRHDPLNIEVSCLEPIPHWNPDAKRYELKYKNNDFEDLVHNYFEKCPSDMHIDLVDYKLTVGINSNAVSITLQFKRFDTAKSVPRCTKEPKISVEKGVLDYHQSTILKLLSTDTRKCAVHVIIEGCESTQGQLFILRPGIELVTDYWCANNSTGQIVVTGIHVYKKTEKVAKNFMPHRQQLENLFAVTYDNVKEKFSLNSLLSIFSDIDIVGVFNYIYDFWHFNFYSLLASILAFFIVYRAIVTFDVGLMIFGVFIFFLSTMTSVLSCWSYSFPKDFGWVRQDLIEDIIINTTFKVVEEIEKTANVVAPKTALIVIKTMDNLSWLTLSVVLSYSMSIMMTIGTIILIRLVTKIILIRNIDRPKQDVMITLPGMPWVGVLMYRTLTRKMSRIYIQRKTYSTKNIIDELAAPILCSDGILSFSLEKLKEGNNIFEEGVVYRRGDFFYTAEHCVDEETKKKNRCIRDVCTNDPDVMIGAELVEIVGFELSKGQSGFVVTQDGKEILFQLTKHNKPYGRMLLFSKNKTTCRDDKSVKTIDVAPPYSKEETRPSTSKECKCKAGECYSQTCEKFIAEKKKAIRARASGGSYYTDPYDRSYTVRTLDGKIGLVFPDLQASHVTRDSAIHRDGLDLRINNGIDWYRGSLEPWCLYTFEYSTNTWFRTSCFEDWVLSPDERCLARCLMINKRGRKLISGSLIYIKRSWGFGKDKYTPVAVVVGETDEYSVASRPGQDYIYLKDNNVTFSSDDLKHNFVDHTIDDHILTLRLNATKKYKMRHTMTDVGDDPDEGIDSDFRAFMSENLEFVNYIGSAFPDYFLNIDIKFLELIAAEFNACKDSDRDALVKLVEQIYDKGDPVEILEKPILNFKNFTSNYQTEIKELIQVFNDNCVEYYVNDKPTVSVQNVIILNNNFWDDHSYRATAIVQLRRSKILKAHVEKDIIVVTYFSDLNFASSLLNFLFTNGVKTVHLKIPSDDIFLVQFEKLVYLPYWVVPNSMLLLEITSSKIMELAKHYKTDNLIYQDWPHLKRLFPSRIKRAEQFGPHSYSNISQNSLKLWKEVHHAIANREHPPRVQKANIVNWDAFNTMNDRYYIMQLQTAVSVGTAFGQNGSLISNQHVTNGRDVMYSVGENTFVWSKPIVNDADADLVIYSDDPVQFAEVSIGEIVVAVNPPANWAQYFVCTGLSPDKTRRMFRAVIIEDDTFHYSQFCGMPGASGTPLVNRNSEVVGVYGSGLWRVDEVPTASGALQPLAGLTQVSGVALRSVDMSNHFKKCAMQVINKEITSDCNYYLVEEPTGSGKSTLFPLELLINCRNPSNILMLLPNVAAVRNVYSRIRQKIELDKIADCIVSFEVGIGNEDYTETYPENKSTGKKLTIKTYGKNVWQLKSIINYDYIVLDEIHNIEDADVVITDAYCNKAVSPKKLIKMTATPVSRKTAFILGGDEKIDTFRYPIDESLVLKRHTGKGKEKLDPENYIISNQDIRCIDGAFKIPKNKVNEGVVIFMVASVNDVKRGIDWARKNNYPGQVFGIHSGTIKDLKSIPNECWIFATDVIGQSVTIANLACMIDLLKEYKPRVNLDIADDMIEYRNDLVLRTISRCKQKQRMGRLGRTRPGTYMRPEGLNAVADFATETAVGPTIVLKLAAIGVPLHVLKCDANSDLVNFLEKFEWLHPESIIHNNAFKETVNRVIVATGRKRISLDMVAKLNLVIQINGDPVWWYLTPIISQEMKARITSDPLYSKMGEKGLDQQFLRNISKFICEVKKDEEICDILSPTIIHSFKEKFMDNETLDELLTPIDTPESVEQLDSKTFVIGLPVVGALIMGIAGSTSLLEKYSTRYVIDVWSIEKENLAGVGKSIVETLKTDIAGEITRQSWTIFLDQIKQWIITNFRKLKTKLGFSEVKDSVLHLNLQLILNNLKNFAGPVITYVGGFTFLSQMLGSTAFGVMYRTFESILGTLITNVILSALTAYVTLTFTTSNVCKLVFCLITGFVVNGIHRSSSAKSLLDDNSASSSAATRMIASVVAGGLLASGLVTIPVAPATSLISPSSSAYPSNVVLLKQIYLLFVKHDNLNAGEHVAVLGDMMYNLFNLGPSGALIGGLTIALLFGIRQVYHHYLAQYASEIKHGQEGQNAGLEMFRRMDQFDSMALMLLSSAATFANPLSLISTAIHYIADMLNGKEASLRTSFEVGSGMNPIWMLAVKLFEVVSHHTNTQKDSAMWYSAIGSLLSTTCATLYYTTRRDSEVCNVVMRWVNVVWYYVKQAAYKIGSMVSKCLTAAGECFGNGAIKAAKDNIPGLSLVLKNKKEKSNLMVERPVIRGRSSKVSLSLFSVWKNGGGFTEAEVLLIQSGAGQYDRNGNLNSEFIVECIPESVSVSKTLTLNRPFAFVQVQNQAICDTVNKLIGIGSFKDGVIQFPTSAGTLSFQHNYTDNTAIMGFSITIMKFEVKAILKIVASGQKCKCVMLAKNLPNDAVKKILGILSEVHAVFRDLTDVLDLELTEAIKFFKPHLDLKHLKSSGLVNTLILGGVAMLLRLDKEQFSENIVRKPKNISKRLWGCKKYAIIRSLYGLAIEFHNGKNPILNLPEIMKQEIVTLDLHSELFSGETIPGSDIRMVKENENLILAETNSFEVDTRTWLAQLSNLCYRSKRTLFVRWTEKETDMYINVCKCHCRICVDLTTDEATMQIINCNSPHCISIDVEQCTPNKDIADIVYFTDEEKQGYYKYHQELTGRDSNIRVTESSSWLTNMKDNMLQLGTEQKDCWNLWKALFNFKKKDNRRNSKSLLLVDAETMHSDPDKQLTQRDKLFAIMENVNMAIVKRSELQLAEEDMDEWYEAEDYSDEWTALPFLQGFRKPYSKNSTIFSPTTTNNITQTCDPPRPKETIDLWNRLNNRGEKLTGKQWEKIQKCGRVQLPKRNITEDDTTYTAIGRGGYKMQQLHEANPDFFRDRVNILDVCCGYGGFEDYLAWKYAEASSRNIYLSTLNEKKHRLLNVSEIGPPDSNVRLIDISNYKRDEHDIGNIKQPNTFKNHVQTLKKFTDNIDLIIFDVGEFKHTSEAQKSYWKQPIPNGWSMIDAYQHYFKLLQPGGRALVKFTGYFQGGLEIFYQIVKSFKKIGIFKVGTSSLFSTEFYIFLEGYKDGYEADIASVRNVWNLIGCYVHDNLQKAYQILTCRGRGYSTLVRNDWYTLQGSGVLYQPLGKTEMQAGGLIQYTIKGKEVKVNWSQDYNQKVKVWNEEVNAMTGTRVKIEPATKTVFENLKSLGSIKRKQKTKVEKDQYNGLISDAVYNIFGINKDNSTYGQTQYTPEWRDAAIKKRLDTNPGSTPPHVLKELHQIIELMLTEEGQNRKDSFEFATKEEVISYVNNQGATGLFDRGHNLKEFMEKFPNWYELAFKLRIDKWRRGEPTGSYNTVRYKPESKQKKVVTEGKLDYEPGTRRETIAESNNLTPRFITFFDSITRLAHYIVIGKFLSVAGQNKMYKGSINGMPPHKVGSFMKGVYDLHQPLANRSISPENVSSKTVTFTETEMFNQENAQVGCLDYSNWDATVTAEERMLEALHVKSFFKDQHKKTVENMLKDMCFAICVNDEGDIWIRNGQRGSGELMTSYGNTLLVQANTVRAICKCLGQSPEQVLRTVSKCHVDIGNGKTKTYEITAVPTYSDGDDTVIITDNDKMTRIKNNISEILEEAGKIIRVGNKPGIKVSKSFSDLEFCSHRYEPVLVGTDASNLSMTREQIEKGREGYNLLYLPTKYASDIISKSRLTLKVVTRNWNPNDLKEGGCVEITRAKIFSYGLLYPHIRAVRMLILTLLTITGDLTTDLTRFKKRYSDLVIEEKTTMTGALSKLYGVTNFTDIGYQQYHLHSTDMRIIKYNVQLTNDYCYTQVKSIAACCFNWSLNQKPKYLAVYLLDKKMTGYLQKWLENAMLRDDRLLAINQDAIQSIITRRITWINQTST